MEDLMIREIKKIELWSAIKISFLVHAVIGIVIGILIGLFMAFIFGVAGQVDPYGAGRWGDFNPAAFGMIGGFMIGLLYAVIIAVVNGFIVTLIVVLLYNLFAGWLGGIKVHFKDEAAQAAAPSAYQPPPEATGGVSTDV
jgi:ABC-type multidrug transport system permease subunit